MVMVSCEIAESSVELSRQLYINISIVSIIKIVRGTCAILVLFIPDRGMFEAA